MVVSVAVHGAGETRMLKFLWKQAEWTIEIATLKFKTMYTCLFTRLNGVPPSGSICQQSG